MKQSVFKLGDKARLPGPKGMSTGRDQDGDVARRNCVNDVVGIVSLFI